MGSSAPRQPPTWRTRLPLFVWVIIFDLSGKGGPTSSIRYRQHSSRVHVTTQAPPLHQSRDTVIQNRTKEICKNVINERAIQAANFISSIYLLIMVNTMLLRPSLRFTTLHPTTLHSTSLHLSTLHFVPFKLLPATLH